MGRTTMRKCLGLLFIVFLFNLHSFSFASSALKNEIRRSLADHPSLSGRVFEVHYQDLTPWQAACPDWRVDLPFKTRMMGNLRLQIFCSSNPKISRNLQVSVSVSAPVLVASRNLSPGQILQPEDWRVALTDLAKLPPDVIEEKKHAENKEILRFVRAGTPLSLNDLRTISVIKKGDFVKVNLIGSGFTVTTAGQSMSNAATGDIVRVKTAEGKVLQGKAISSGLVEVYLD